MSMICFRLYSFTKVQRLERVLVFLQSLRYACSILYFFGGFFCCCCFTFFPWCSLYYFKKKAHRFIKYDPLEGGWSPDSVAQILCWGGQTQTPLLRPSSNQLTFIYEKRNGCILALPPSPPASFPGTSDASQRGRSAGGAGSQRTRRRECPLHQGPGTPRSAARVGEVSTSEACVILDLCQNWAQRDKESTLEHTWVQKQPDSPLQSLHSV